MSPSSAFARRLAARLKVSPAEAAAAADAVLRNRMAVRLVPAVVSPAVFIGWMIVFGRGTQVLEGTRLDLLGWVHSHGVAGLVVSVALGYGVAIALGTTAYVLVRRFMIARAVSALPRGDDGRLLVCEECLYPMGHARTSEIVRCPECGADYFKTSGSAT